MRKSNPKQSEWSITGQEDLCLKLIEHERLKNMGGEADEARTGRTLFRRPGLRKLVERIKAGEIKVLVAETVDRFSRNTADLHALYQTLCEHGAVMMTVQEGLIDEMRLTFLALKAAQDVRQTQERVKRGLNEVLKDERIAGSVGFGYRKVQTEGGPNGLREKHPINAPIATSMLEDFGEGVSAFKICKRLNAAGVKAPRGGKWRQAVLLGSKDYGVGILRNRMYIGEFVYRRTQRELKASTGKTITRPGRKDEQHVLPVPHLRLVSDEVWEKVQARLEAGRLRNQPTGEEPLTSPAEAAGPAEEDQRKPWIGEHRRATYVFSGKMLCGLCGEKMVVLGKRVGCDGRVNMGNDCPNNVRIPRPEIEAAIFEGIREHLLQPELLNPYLAEYAEAEAKLLATRGDEQARLKAQLAETETEIENLLGIAAKSRRDSRGAERLAAELDRLEEQRLSREAELAAVTRVRAPAPTSPKDVIAGVEQLLDRLGPAMEGDDPDAVRSRELMRELIDEIVITPLPTPTKQRRGSEPVEVVVTGKMDDLFEISQTTLGRVTLSGSRTETCQGHASQTFRFEVVLNRRQPKLSQTALDSKLIERMLDEAAVPLTNAFLVEALLDGAHPDPEARRAVEARVRNVLHLLHKAKRVRSIRLGRPVGWVWNHRPLTDDEWRERATPDVEGSYTGIAALTHGPAASVVTLH